jgi:sn-glycerol 3-phosphate transport system ATP-binding protein
MPRDIPDSDERQRLALPIRIEGVSKRFAGGAPVLDHVSITIEAGEFAVLLGPSGCGKTTLLRIVAGLETADSGRVWIGGRDVTALPPAARGLAMVFQSYALFPHLTVAENILFGLRARRVAPMERTRRLETAASMLGLGPLLGRKPGQLSGGQQQRVALGRAVVAEAPVCLMDEPLSNLDAQLRAEMRREILALQRRLGITMLYVTHDQTEAMGMADQVVLLRAGGVEQDAPPAALYSEPSTVFAAAFIGQPPMNLLPLVPGAGGMVAGGTEGPVLAQHAATAGLRPEALSLSDTGLPATVEHAEYLGADTVLQCRVGTTAVLARLPGRVMAEPGRPIRLGFAPAALHLFGADGRRLAQDVQS